MPAPTTRRGPTLSPRDAQAEQTINQGYTLTRNPICPTCREQKSRTGQCACT